MTLRMDAADSSIPPFDKVRDPTGSPVSRYDSTICLKMSRERWFNACIIDVSELIAIE